MKYVKVLRTFIFALIFFVPLLSVHADATYSRTPTGMNVYSPVSIHFEGYEYDIGTYTPFFFDCMTELTGCSYRAEVYSANSGYFYGACHEVTQNEYINHTDNIVLPFGTDATYVIFQTFKSSDCSTANYHADVYETVGGGVIFTVSEQPPAPPVAVNGITALRESTEAGFQQTTGDTMGGAVAWAGDSFIKVILGSALGVLLALRYWIVALVIIGIIVYFYQRVSVNAVEHKHLSRKWTNKNRK